MEVTGWINLTILLSILATLLQVAGFVAPMWIWLDVDDFRVGVGLWFTVGCGLQGTCSTTAPTVSFGYTTDDTWSKPQFNAVRGLETVAVAGGVLLLLFLLVYRVGYGKWTNMGELNLAAFLTAVLCWLTILAGLIVFCAYYWPVVGTSPLVNTNSFPWSLVLCLFAAFFFIVVCVLIRVKCRDRSRLKNAIPISGDTRMETYPVTKHGLLHRYFLPLYRGLRGNSRAIGYQSEAKNIRLVDAEEHTQVAAIDNAAFYENRVLEGNNVNYRHLPIQNGHAGTPRHHHQQAETVIRRSLPTAIVTYTDGQANDLHRLHTQGGAAATTAAGGEGAAQQHAGQQGHQRAGARDALLLRHADDGGARDVIYREGGADTRGGGGGGAGYQSGGASPRDGIDQQGGGVTSRDAAYRAGVVTSDVTYQTTTRAGGEVTYGQAAGGETRGPANLQGGHLETTGEGAAGLRDFRYQNGAIAGMREGMREGDASRTAAGGGGGAGGAAYLSEAHSRDAVAAYQRSGDAVTTRDGAFGQGGVRRDAFGNIITEERVTTTTTTTTYITEEGRLKRGGLKVTEIESNDGSSQHHFSAVARGTRSGWSDDASVKPYDDTYIYRPYAEKEA